MVQPPNEPPEQAPTSALRRRATLYDVAKLAGVSHQTVSQVVKDGPNVRAETRQRVESAIAELGYTPNLVARALVTARSRRVAALFFDRYADLGPTKNMQAAVDEAREAGYIVDVLGVDAPDDALTESTLELALQANAEGILVFAPTIAAIDSIRRRPVPVPMVIEALIPAEAKDPRFEGAAIAVDHLADLGHRRIMVVSGPLGWMVAKDRVDQALTVAARRGLQVVRRFEGDWTARAGYSAGLDIPLDDGITAVAVGNDQMALGVMKALHRRGARVPADISVVGFDNIPESAFYEPALTTIAEDFEGGGRVAMDVLLSAIDPTRPRTILHRQPPRLIVRESTGPAPH